MSRSGQIIERKEGAITFIVDANLPMAERHLKYPRTGREIAGSILEKRSKSGHKPEILAVSCSEANLYGYGEDVFFQMLVTAFAEHRPVVISPDVIWVLICQGFSHHINQNPELFRNRFVDHKGKEEIIVNVCGTEDLTLKEWGDIIVGFAKQVEKNTKNKKAGALVADFSTTGPTEAIASRITLLDTVKPFFEFIVHRILCGIPFITLLGKPEDWEKIISNVQHLAEYDLGWWTSELVPILQEFVATSKGKPKAGFWKSIVKTWRPGSLRGRGCGGWGPPPSTINGWFLKLFPYNRHGHTPEKVDFDETMLPETVSVPFVYKILDDFGNLITETPMEITAGIIGIEENADTYALTPKIAWFVSKL